MESTEFFPLIPKVPCLKSEKTLQMDLQQAKNSINLNVLKRYDKAICSIIQTSSHVVLYDFDPTKQSWVLDD
jgi:hypothetical protein